MNERIKDLALEAIVENISSDLWVFNDAELEKFAQLIVQECSNFLKDTLDDHFAAEQLEEHFGVKE